MFNPPKKQDIGNVYERNNEATLYVANIDPRVDEEILCELFIQCGQVKNVYIPRDKVNGTHSGYGFVEFEYEFECEYAAKILNLIKLYGKPIRCNKASQDKRITDVGAHLFIGNLDETVDEKMLLSIFSAFGRVISAKVIRDDDMNSKGHGFISYDNFESSDLAIENMNNEFISNKKVHISYAYKKDSKGERHGTAAERFIAANKALALYSTNNNNSSNNSNNNNTVPPPPPPPPSILPSTNQTVSHLPTAHAHSIPPPNSFANSMVMNNNNQNASSNKQMLPPGYMHKMPNDMMPPMMNSFYLPPGIPPPTHAANTNMPWLISTATPPPFGPMAGMKPNLPPFRPPPKGNNRMFSHMPPNLPFHIPPNIPPNMPSNMPPNMPPNIPPNMPPNMVPDFSPNMPFPYNPSIPPNMPPMMPQNFPPAMPPNILPNINNTQMNATNRTRHTDGNVPPVASSEITENAPSANNASTSVPEQS